MRPKTSAVRKTLAIVYADPQGSRILYDAFDARRTVGEDDDA